MTAYRLAYTATYPSGTVEEKTVLVESKPVLSDLIYYWNNICKEYRYFVTPEQNLKNTCCAPKWIEQVDDVLEGEMVYETARTYSFGKV